MPTRIRFTYAETVLVFCRRPLSELWRSNSRSGLKCKCFKWNYIIIIVHRNADLKIHQCRYFSWNTASNPDRITTTNSKRNHGINVPICFIYHSWFHGSGLSSPITSCRFRNHICNYIAQQWVETFDLGAYSGTAPVHYRGLSPMRKPSKVLVTLSELRHAKWYDIFE